MGGRDQEVSLEDCLGGVEWIQLAQAFCRAFVYAAMNLQVLAPRCYLLYNTFSYAHRPNLSTDTDLSKQELLRYKVGYLFILTQIDKQISSTRVFRHHSICWCVNI
jgi:hypothetical protein